jgi:hypothetical protein
MLLLLWSPPVPTSGRMDASLFEQIDNLFHIRMVGVQPCFPALFYDYIFVINFLQCFRDDPSIKIMENMEFS